MHAIPAELMPSERLGQHRTMARSKRLDFACSLVWYQDASD